MEIEIAKITSKGQIVIPQDIREKKRIRKGEKFLVYDNDDSIILKRLKGLENTKNIEEFENNFRSMWKTAKEKGITREDVKKEIIDYRKEKSK